MEMMIENWYVAVGFMALGAAVVLALWRFVQLPSAVQLEKVQSWLLLAVSEAERKRHLAVFNMENSAASPGEGAILTCGTLGGITDGT